MIRYAHYMAATSVAQGTGRAVLWLARQVEVLLAEHVELTLAQYRLLALLDDRPAAASELAEKLAVSRPSVTTVADGLVNRGLIERATDTRDRRRVNHALTDEGRALVRRTDKLVETGLGVVMNHLDPSGARDIASGFESLRRLTERIKDEQRVTGA
jgi:DNA-binding MarR family transcriptional regulator